MAGDFEKRTFWEFDFILTVLQLGFEQPNYWSWHLISTDL
jgi:hypothetical protein